MAPGENSKNEEGRKSRADAFKIDKENGVNGGLDSIRRDFPRKFLGKREKTFRSTAKYCLEEKETIYSLNEGSVNLDHRLVGKIDEVEDEGENEEPGDDLTWRDYRETAVKTLP